MSEYLAQVLPLFSMLLGLCLGSFANVVIYRWPKGESVVLPSSRCPKCQSKIRFYDNIPVFSWLLLRGRCRDCKTLISPRYPMVELSMGILFFVIYFKTGATWTLLEYWLFGFGLLTVSVIDLDHFLLPDLFTLSGVVIGLVGAFLNPEREFLDALYGVLMGGGFLWAIAYLYFVIRKEEGMGGGDIKLIAWIGAVLGWKAIPFVIMSSSIIGSLVGIFVATKSGKGLKAAIPFGPFLALGAVIFILGGKFLADAYLKLFFVQFE